MTNAMFMAVRWTCCGVLALVACGATPDGAGPPDGPPTCQGLFDRFEAIAGGLSRQCDTDGDCAALGGKYEATCACEPVLPHHAVNGAAYQASDLPEIERTFYAQCTDSMWFGDCERGPVNAHCSNHQCVAFTNSCVDFDAGP